MTPDNAKVEAALGVLSLIAGDYHPNTDKEAPLALAEMREALTEALSMLTEALADAKQAGYLAGLAAAKEAVPEAGHAPECTSLYEEGIFEGRFEIRKETLANIAALEKEAK